MDGGRAYLDDGGGINISSGRNSALSSCSEGAKEEAREGGREGGRAYLNDARGIDIGSSRNAALSSCSEGAKEEGLTPSEDPEEGVTVDVALAFTW